MSIVFIIGWMLALESRSGLRRRCSLLAREGAMDVCPAYRKHGMTCCPAPKPKTGTPTTGFVLAELWLKPSLASERPGQSCMIEGRNYLVLAKPIAALEP
jgi:hypothetical protein